MERTRQLNKFERKMLRPFWIFVVLFVVEVITMVVIVKLSIPRILKVFQVVNTLIAIKALLSGFGYFEQNTPLGMWSFNRSFSLLYLFIFKFTSVRLWKVLGIVLLVDAIFYGFLLYDKSIYCYESEDVEE